MSNMNLPNKLTILRVFLIPVFIIVMKLPISYGNIIALIVFVVASLTDMLDGKIARKYNLVTNFGKFMDPLADKLLVCSAMICLIDTNQIPSWVVIVIIAREFIISGFRLIAVDNGIVIAASMWGKVKTVCQMGMIIFMLLISPEIQPFGYWVFCQIFMYLAMVMTVVSLIDYMVKNKSVLKDTK